MTLDAAETNQVTEIAARVAAEMVRNLVRGTGGATLSMPVQRLGTVGGRADAGDECLVRGDGDTDAVPAVNATGMVVEAGDRVVIEWMDRGTVRIVYQLSRASRGNWTPTILGPSSVSTGQSSTGHYTRRGHSVTVYGQWTFGVGTSVGTAGAIGGLPFPVISDSDGGSLPAILNCVVNDVSIPRFYDAEWIISEGNTFGQVFVPFAFSTPTYGVMSPITNGAAPMAWATGDQIIVHGTYDTDAA